jgi:hypothetical protein
LMSGDVDLGLAQSRVVGPWFGTGFVGLYAAGPDLGAPADRPMGAMGRRISRWSVRSWSVIPADLQAASTLLVCALQRAYCGRLGCRGGRGRGSGCGQPERVRVEGWPHRSGPPPDRPGCRSRRSSQLARAGLHGQLSPSPDRQPSPYAGSSSRRRSCCQHKHMIVRRLPYVRTSTLVKRQVKLPMAAALPGREHHSSLYPCSETVSSLGVGSTAQSSRRDVSARQLPLNSSCARACRARLHLLRARRLPPRRRTATGTPSRWGPRLAG